uniref:Cytosine-specific methyltransferase n=1 Tax=Prevotella sp. GTC17259 TaxID=3236795 RepID=A0AB33J535_9BACT
MTDNRGNRIRVVELFAGVGGFRVGLEGASDAYDTIWNNQWEPSTTQQDASLVYRARFGLEGHSNEDINNVRTADIPNHDLLVGGFPCQDYSVASTLSRSGGIEGKKGVLWWQIYRILREKGNNRPQYLFFENVDRLLGSPAKQRGRDFAIILASLSDLGYIVEWRVINAADYGMPQRRRRTYIIGYKASSVISNKIESLEDWLRYDGVMAKAFPAETKGVLNNFDIEGAIQEVSACFNEGKKNTPFGNAGIMCNRRVLTTDVTPIYEGTSITLGNILINDDFVPEEFFISDKDLPKWEFEKGSKKIKRISKEGYEYVFSEGAMAFPDNLDRPSRTIITGEGGTSPSRFKHVVQTRSGRYRRLLPIELERLNMFPDNHTYHHLVSDGRRAFLMGNALVCGIVQKIGQSLYRCIYDEEPVSSKPIDMERGANPYIQLSLFENAENSIVFNKMQKTYKLNPNKHLLIGYVKPDTVEYFLDGGASKVYYTGKTKSFPSTIALNKLYYFMPYIKGRGVRDLYLIHIARIGNKAEIHFDSKDKDPRLVFELEYLESFTDYKPVKLNIFNTYRDTVLWTILNKE